VYKFAAAAMCAMAASPVPHDAADTPPPKATMSCAPVSGPGRVHCEVEARVEAGQSIRWADVILVATPPFVSALRARIGPRDATQRTARSWRWAFALVARERGSGDVEGTVRLVVCREAVCLPEKVPVRAQVAVGE
jgi:hypothetical protein